jgi:hypothetical protein
MKSTFRCQLALAGLSVLLLMPGDLAASEGKAPKRVNKLGAWLGSSLAGRLGLRAVGWGMRKIDLSPHFASRHQKLTNLTALVETRAANRKLEKLLGNAKKKRFTIGETIAWPTVDRLVNQVNRARDAQFSASPAVRGELQTMHDNLKRIQIDARTVEKNGQVGNYNLELKRERAFQSAKDRVGVLVEILNASSPN